MADPYIAAARSRSHLAALWLAKLATDGVDMPSQVQQFFTCDVPYLLALALQDRQPTSACEVVEATRTADLLAQLVDLARLANDATETSADPALWRARESDLREGFEALPLRQVRALAEVAVRALAETGWPGPVAGPSTEQVVPWWAPEWRGPER